MSAPRSVQARMIKKYGKMAEQYQERINNQQEIITRLTQAVSTAQTFLFDIENNSKDVKSARRMAKEGQALVIETLKKDEEQKEEQ